MIVINLNQTYNILINKVNIIATKAVETYKRYSFFNKRIGFLLNIAYLIDSTIGFSFTLAVVIRFVFNIVAKIEKTFYILDIVAIFTSLTLGVLLSIMNMFVPKKRVPFGSQNINIENDATIDSHNYTHTNSHLLFDKVKDNTNEFTSQ